MKTTHTPINPYHSLWQNAVPDIAWGTVALFIGYVSGYTLVIIGIVSGHLPYELATIFCAYLAYVGFTIAHDAGHGSIIASGSRFKFVESLLGWITAIPLLLVPFPLFKRIHDRHHAFTNDPDRDPDHFSFGNRWYQVLLNCFYIPIQYHHLAFTKLKNIKTIRDTYPTTFIYFVLVLSGIVGLIIHGYSQALLYVIIIPNAIAILALALFFDYIPHHPHKSLDRYHDSRIYPSKILNGLLLGQNYHLVHHMYPKVPWYRYKTVYEQILPDLERNQSPIEDLSGINKPGFMKSINGNRLIKGNKFMNMLLPVSDIKPLTDDSVLIEFELPHEQSLDFNAGQYITLSKWLNGEQHTRCYSLCVRPPANLLQIAVRKQQQGVFSEFLNSQLAIGDQLIVKGPFGEFKYPPAHRQATEQLTLIAGGSGITPIISILTAALTQSASVKIHLIYTCRNAQQIMFIDDLEALQSAHSDRFTVSLIITEKGLGGSRLTSDRLNQLIDLKANRGCHDFYICGPQGLNQIATKVLIDRDVAPKNIHLESFSQQAEQPVGDLHQVVICLDDGLNCQLEVASNQTVLGVALQSGVAIPHACAQGTCGVCKLKLESGSQVPIADSLPGLTQQERLAGYTLACQCKPSSDLVLKESNE
ncbi:2Fe-2S iron-sulfur cluster binding domain-containing protein [Aliikangiella marina]|uniref:2Fe-2S iron-sulfur cluster binding domain-containing protein n=1 Tax=Aliikangiella marina TaxID=1712262 RepID=A0A545T153_9GAMM|nr:fatty acid desaturase [Aliikangiella marina]TQV70931.1 2Fe-2S iron-sulfur cluster binding domain-containing protein [Aliikangiella marina]